MRKICLILGVAVVAACSKKSNEENSLSNLTGTWVEASLRLDTIVFNYKPLIWSWPASEKVLLLSAKPFNDPMASGAGYMNISNLYKYKIQNDTVSMLALTSSSLLYHSYEIKQTGLSTISVDKFYLRSSLPNKLTFIRVQ